MFRQLIRNMRKADEAGVDLTIPFVVDAKTLADGRRFKQPDVARVGPVRSGSLREFEEPTP